MNEKLETAFSIILAVPSAWVALSRSAGVPLGTFLTPYTLSTGSIVRLARTLNFILIKRRWCLIYIVTSGLAPGHLPDFLTHNFVSARELLALSEAP